MVSIIEVKDLVKVYNGSIRAVDGITFDVAEGEVFGFLGPNGAGKTTTISVLTTLLQKTSGECRVCGIDVVKNPTEVRRSIGLVPQEMTVDDDLTEQFVALFFFFLSLLAQLRIARVAECHRCGDALQVEGLRARPGGSGVARGRQGGQPSPAPEIAPWESRALAILKDPSDDVGEDVARRHRSVRRPYREASCSRRRGGAADSLGGAATSGQKMQTGHVEAATRDDVESLTRR